MLPDPEARDLTTFMPSWGRYPYLVNHQGLLVSGHAYMYHNGKIMETVECWVRCVDDCALLDRDFTDHFCNGLELVVKPWHHT